VEVGYCTECGLVCIQAEFANVNVAAYSDTGAVVDITTVKHGVQVIQ